MNLNLVFNQNYSFEVRIVKYIKRKHHRRHSHTKSNMAAYKTLNIACKLPALNYIAKMRIYLRFCNIEELSTQSRYCRTICKIPQTVLHVENTPAIFKFRFVHAIVTLGEKISISRRVFSLSAENSPIRALIDLTEISRSIRAALYKHFM